MFPQVGSEPKNLGPAEMAQRTMNTLPFSFPKVYDPLGTSQDSEAYWALLDLPDVSSPSSEAETCLPTPWAVGRIK